MLLDEIIDNKKLEALALVKQFKSIKLQNLKEAFPDIRDFTAALKKPGRLALIAEIKKASPSAGVIVEQFDPEKIARTYQEAGVDAVSVVTDEKYFKGLLSHLRRAREACLLPILRKDFIIDELQIVESRLAGADAVLLIARILTPEQLKAFLAKCGELSLSALVEVHNENDLEKALGADAQIIGVNNRDLDTLKVDFETSLKLAAKYKELRSKTLVSESGIDSPSQVKELKSAGFHAVLIGEALLKSPDIKQKIEELFS